MSTQLRLTDANLADYLRSQGLFAAGATIRVGKAGDGNINWVRRATEVSPRGVSYVVKQARPALERFPEYEVSTERLVFEARYFEQVRSQDEGQVCPRVHAFDEANRVLILEDLGKVPRLDLLLLEGCDATGAAQRLGGFLGRVHRSTGAGDLADLFRNEEMRRLHGDHIFKLPFEANEFPLPPRTRERAEALWGDAEVADLAAAAYARYLEARDALVHGDVQAGNVLLAAAGAKLLDAEIAHVGDPAFDLGTLIAHLQLAGVARGRARETRGGVAAAWSSYVEAYGRPGRTPFEAVARYAGLELLRRTLGAARVAAVEDDDAGLRVIDRGLAWLRKPPARPD